ncbi:MAG: hypothetical protein ACOVLE_03255 [Pirellula staleyi]
MSTPIVDARTPQYVLMEGKERIGPKVASLQDGVVCSAIYGFSDKQPYEAFCSHSSLALTPYPLVRFYLQSQVDEEDERLKLVVLDAAQSDSDVVFAITVQGALDAHKSGSKSVPIAYRLVFDSDTSEYRVLESVLD